MESTLTVWRIVMTRCRPILGTLIWWIIVSTSIALIPGITLIIIRAWMLLNITIVVGCSRSVVKKNANGSLIYADVSGSLVIIPSCWFICNLILIGEAFQSAKSSFLLGENQIWGSFAQHIPYKGATSNLVFTKIHLALQHLMWCKFFWNFDIFVCVFNYMLCLVFFLYYCRLKSPNCVILPEVQQLHGYKLPRAQPYRYNDHT